MGVAQYTGTSRYPLYSLVPVEKMLLPNPLLSQVRLVVHPQQLPRLRVSPEPGPTRGTSLAAFNRASISWASLDDKAKTPAAEKL